jgi:hypothetical protein
MRKLVVTAVILAFGAVGALAQTPGAPTLRIVAENGNKLPAELLYGNTKVKPIRLRPGTNTPITINDTDFFVQQQYVDFLGRFPDQAGFAFWQDIITQCGSNAPCVEARRVSVSAAFFLSIEHQNTGFFVYRLYKGSFGQFPRYQTFMPESREVGKDIAVGIGEWERKLDEQKQAFAEAFVNRAEFLALYPTSQTPAQFVDALIAKAEITAGDVDRAGIITGLGNGTMTRGTALRRIMESPAFTAKETNNAFVLMQFFGYLRRNPDDPPDTNFNGFLFWLDKLNQFNGNWEQAEMVKAFIQSIEYNSRF